MSKVYEWHDKLDFGKYDGEHLDEVFQRDPEYVNEVLEDHPNFSITKDTLIHLQDLDPDFKFTDKAMDSVMNQRKYNSKPGQSEFKMYPTGDPFIQPLDDISFDQEPENPED